MFYIIVILAGIFTMPAKADETLKFRHVQHVASVQTQQVGDVNGHLLGLFRLPGMAFFPDGSTGTTLVIGLSDINSSGSISNGYYTVNFGDGSELWFKFSGTVTPGPGTKTIHKGTAIVIGGKGRYMEAKGEGTYQGEGTQSAVLPGETIMYIDNVINIKK